MNARGVTLALLLVARCGMAMAQDAPPVSGAPRPASVELPAAQPSVGTPHAAGLVQVFPGVRIDRANKIVEIDGEVPIDVNSNVTPITYLEVMVCTHDTKEHESLVMTSARAAHVHAALLLLGLEPGKPGSWGYDARTRKMTDTPPKGPRLDVLVVTKDADGAEKEARLSDWAVRERDGKALTSTIGEPALGCWVFAGSREKVIEGQNVYKADADGTLVGLCTFGSETVAWEGVLSPEEAVQEPEWIADKKTVPPPGTKVVVRIKVCDQSKEQEAPVAPKK